MSFCRNCGSSYEILINGSCPQCGITKNAESDKSQHLSVPSSQITRASILDHAKQYVCTDREGQYGSPESNFALIAGFWKLFEDARRETCTRNGTAYVETAHDVAIKMALLKIARIATGRPKEDNYADGCGYLACAGEIACREKMEEMIGRVKNNE